MSKKLEGKTALITGGSRGIGSAIAKRLAQDGANVAITYARDPSSGTTAVGAIERSGGKAVAIEADSLDDAAIQRAVAKTVEAFGSLDILVNNAGTAIPKPFEDGTIEEFATNVPAPFFLLQQLLSSLSYAIPEECWLECC